MLGPVWLMTERVDWERSQGLPPRLSSLYRRVLDTHVARDGSAALLQLHTSFLPRGPGGWSASRAGALRGGPAVHAGATWRHALPLMRGNESPAAPHPPSLPSSAGLGREAADLARLLELLQLHAGE